MGRFWEDNTGWDNASLPNSSAPNLQLWDFGMTLIQLIQMEMVKVMFISILMKKGQ